MNLFAPSDCPSTIPTNSLSSKAVYVPLASVDVIEIELKPG